MSQWDKAPVEKALWCQCNIPHGLQPPMEKAWFYERLFVVVMVKDKNAMAKKMQYETYNVSKNQFSALHIMDKGNVISSFQEI